MQPTAQKSANHPIQIQFALNAVDNFPRDLIEKIIILGKFNIETVKALRLVNRTWRTGADLALRNLSVPNFHFFEKLEKFSGLNLVICKKNSKINWAELSYHAQTLLISGIHALNVTNLTKNPKFDLFYILYCSRQKRCMLSELIKIYYWMTSGCDRALTKLSLLPNLRALHLEGIAELTDSGLTLLSQFSRITSLSIVDCPSISIRGLQRLIEIQHLRAFQCSLPVTDPLSMLRDIADICSARKLEYPDHHLARQIRLLTRNNPKKLNGLKLVGMVGSDALAHIANLPALHELTICGDLREESLRALARLTTLTALEMSKCHSCVTTFEPFQPLHNLKSLNLKDIGVCHLQELTLLNQLTQLSLKGLKRKLAVLPTEIRILPNLINLQKLTLKRMALENESASTLQLAELKLKNCKVNTTAMNCLGNLANLRKLTLQNTPLPNEFQLKHFTRIASLAHLTIDNCRLAETSNGADQELQPSLAPLVNLVYLQMSRCKLTEKQLALMATLPNVSKLNLENSEVSEACQMLKILQTKCTLIPPKIKSSDIRSRIHRLFLSVLDFFKKILKKAKSTHKFIQRNHMTDFLISASAIFFCLNLFPLMKRRS